MRLSQVLLLLALVTPTTVFSADVAPLPKSVNVVKAQQPVSAEPELTAVVNKYYVELKVKNVAKGTAIIWDSFPEDRAETRIIKVEQAYILTGPPGEYRVKVRLVKGEDVTELRWQGKLTGGVTPPQPPPNPPDIDPKPPEPKPVPVTSFRVLFVYDPLIGLTKEEHSTIYAKSVRDFLNTKTTKDDGHTGWRIWSNRQVTDGETETMKALWKTVQPQLTVIPCLVIEVNGKAEIINLPSSPEEAVATFEKYLKGGK